MQPSATPSIQSVPPAPPDPDLPYPPYRRWLFAVAAALVVATFGLLALGGHVTSEEAGLAVPDGFTTFGTWSLIAPLETWWYANDTRLEHTHRLMGYAAGSLAIALMVGLLRTQSRRRWIKTLGVVILITVIVQGVLGILRVDERSLWLAGIHGVTGQLFLCLTVLAAAAVGRYWMQRPMPFAEGRHRGGIHFLPLILLALLVVQLILGSAVRHSFSALAIPDWPTNLGRLMPPMDQAGIDAAVGGVPLDMRGPRFDPDGDGTYAAWQVHLHFTHRLGAYVILVFGLWFVARLMRTYRDRSAVWWPAVIVGLLLIAQVTLGVLTVTSGERPSLATLHQTNGAALLAAATWLAIRLHLTPRSNVRRIDAPVAAGDAATDNLADPATGSPTA